MDKTETFLSGNGDAKKNRRVNQLYSVLSDVNKTIVRIRDKQFLFDEITQILVEKGEFLMAWIGFVDETSHLVKPTSWYGNETDYLKAVKISVLKDIKKGQGPTGTAIREATPFVCNDIENDTRMLPWKKDALERGFKASASFPIMRGERAVGAINVYASEANFFDGEEVELLIKLTNDLSYALEFLEQEEEKSAIEKKLKISDERYQLAIRGSYAGIWDMDVVKNEIYFSPQWKELFGYEDDAVTNTFEAWENLIHPDDKKSALDIIHQHWEKKTPYYTSEHRLRCSNGEYKWVLSRGAAIWDESGKPVRMAGSSTDINKKKIFEEKLKLQEEFLAKIINTSPNFIVVKDREGKVVLANEAVSDFCGKPQEELIGKNLEFCLSTEKEKIKKIRQEEENIFKTKEPLFLPEVKYIAKDRNMRWFQTTKTPLFFSDGEVKEILILSSDITLRKRAEETITFHAYHDPLTGLANRLLFEDHLQLATFQSERNENMFAVMYLDLDHFKPINDNFGHDVGDGILQEVARRLNDSVRKCDTVARLGGDEFTVLVTELDDKKDAANVAEKIVNSMQKTFHVLGHKCSISISVGISIFPKDGKEKVELLKKADKALLDVKKEGKNNFRFHQ